MDEDEIALRGEAARRRLAGESPRAIAGDLGRIRPVLPQHRTAVRMDLHARQAPTCARRSRRSAQRRPPRRLVSRSASEPATRRCAPGCAQRLTRASVSVRRTPGCARSWRSRMAASASWSSTGGCGAHELAGAAPRRCSARPRRRVRDTDRPAHRIRSDGAARAVPGASVPLPGATSTTRSRRPAIASTSS
jgi:hypothetical protein